MPLKHVKQEISTKVSELSFIFKSVTEAGVQLTVMLNSVYMLNYILKLMIFTLNIFV